MDLVFSRTLEIPSKSFGRECSLCSSRHGVPIECSARGCKAAYHTTCAIRGKLRMQAIFGKNFKGGIKLRSYCKQHSPSVELEDGTSSQQDKIDASGLKEIDMTNLADDRLQEGSEELDHFWKYVDINEVQKTISTSYRRVGKIRDNSDHSTPKKSKKLSSSFNKDDSSSEKAHSPTKSKSSSCGEASKINSPSRETQEVDPLAIDLIYRYWILLRTANNGQSLIKFSPSALKEREFEQRKSIMKLRIELERVRNLSYMIGKREKLKASWLKTHQNIIKRTFSIIGDLDPALDVKPVIEYSGSTNNSSNHQLSSSHHRLNNHTGSALQTTGKKSLHQTQHTQPINGLFDETDQLVNDLVSCDQIYEPSVTSLNSNLTYHERSTLERRRTLSLARRINRQLKNISAEPSLNPYAKNLIIPKRSDSPVGHTQQPTARALKYR